MIVYLDLITGDELFTDAYKIKFVDDFFIEIDGKMISETDSIDSIKIGANPSAEDVEETCSEVEKKGIDVVLRQRLNETYFGNKKEYMSYLKGYLKKIKEILTAEDVEKGNNFAEAAQRLIAPKMKNFDNFQFFMGESGNPDGHIALVDYRSDEITPYLTFFKAGVRCEKV